MLVPLRMAREHLTARAAVDAVLQENLHGLELDARCVELAAFSLALAAWTYPGAGGYRPLPELNLACSGLAPNATKEQWLALSEPLRNGLTALHDLFAPAPTLGSLIEPRALKANLFQSDFESVRTLCQPLWNTNGQPKSRPSASWPRRGWRSQQSCWPGATTG